MRCSRTRTELAYCALPESVDDNDCGVRALEVALDITYEEAFAFLAAHGREPGEGMPTGWLHSHKRYREPVFGFIIRPYRFGRRLRVKRRQKVLSEGRWLVIIPGHIFAVKDGVIYDTIDLEVIMEGLVTLTWQVLPHR